MSSIGQALLDCLDPVERPGDFCVGGRRDIFMPAIEVDGVGRIAFPLLPAQAGQLIAVADAAPYGRGEETLVDRDVRRTWQIDAGKIRIAGHHWEQDLAGIVAEVATGLGVQGPVAADLYKLLVYDAGSFFVDHRDTEKVPGMFATLVVVLPSIHSGGELVVRHLGREVVLDSRPEEPSEIGFAAFYADCVHEVRPILSGYRPTLVYHLRFLDGRQPPRSPDYANEEGRAAEILRGWAEAAEEPDKLIVALEHAYTPAELSFATLKGRDAGLASVLVAAAAASDCDLHLALASIEESGSAYGTGSYRRRRWDRDGDDDEEQDDFEVIEVSDESRLLTDWRRPDDSAAEFRDFPFSEEELCPPEAFEDLTPDEKHFHEATGNEGASFERTYRRAALVLWPRARRLAVLAQAGIGATLPHLADLTRRWEQSGEGGQSALWREAEELSGHMLRGWKANPWRAAEDPDAARMLDLQVRLGNAGHIEAFLTDLSAEGHYAAADNEAIVRAAALLPRPHATELLCRIVRSNASAHPDGCADLLLRCAAASAGSVADPAQIGAALLEAMPGDATKQAERDHWRRPAPLQHGFVVNLLTGLSRTDSGLALRAIDRMFELPKSYELDAVLVPAALAFAKQPEAREWPAVKRLRAASLDHLRARISLPLEAPKDWRRANPLRCDCADCRAAGAFLADPGQREWRLKAAQDRRTHVEQSIRGAKCDLDLATERRGSPHTLVATKNQASYERRVKQRRRDLDHVAALDE
jgi:hypothetical protein